MEIDLSLNRSLEELVSSYFEAHEAGMGCDSFLAVKISFLIAIKRVCSVTGKE